MQRNKTFLAALYLTLSLSTLFAQQTAIPTIKVNAREIVVDVTVTDPTGQFVSGLTQTDFIIEENGKRQPIRQAEQGQYHRSAASRGHQ